ncbi:MAG TPA: ABC transporter permease [Catenuloplanes sp.]
MELSTFGPRDLLSEAVAGMLQRPGRSGLTMLGTVLGVGAFVAVLGLTATASSQIDERFNVLAATEVTVEDIGTENPADPRMSFPRDAAARVDALNGVVHAGVRWPVPRGVARITTTPDGNPTASAGAADDPGAGLSLLALDPGALATAHPVLSAGRLYDRFHQTRAERVAVLGAAAAGQLGISRLDGGPAVYVGGTAYVVIGIIGDVRRQPDLLLSVIIPTSAALDAYGPPVDQRATMVIETRLGGAQMIARQAPLALRPDAPRLFRSVAPPDPTSLRHSVSSDLNVLFLLLAAVSLLIGAVGIANTTAVAVLERTGEVGLRRSLGARPKHIAAQFLTESTALGALGGLLGTAIGVVTVVLVAVTHRWTAVLQPWAVLPAPLVGAAVGLLAGLYPALRAAAIEPADAIRR